tara:strand:+ start:155 stop:505 length:351 start_codon:yes stop_codon:yes gene_type:complete
MPTKQSRSRILPLAAIAGAVMLLPLAAFAAPVAGDSLGTSAAEIRAALTQQGYAIGDVETENGQIQVEITANGKSYEVKVDQKTGKVVDVEQEDDDHDKNHERSEKHEKGGDKKDR